MLLEHWREYTEKNRNNENQRHRGGSAVARKTNARDAPNAYVFVVAITEKGRIVNGRHGKVKG